MPARRPGHHPTTLPRIPRATGPPRQDARRAPIAARMARLDRAGRARRRGGGRPSHSGAAGRNIALPSVRIGKVRYWPAISLTP